MVEWQRYTAEIRDLHKQAVAAQEQADPTFGERIYVRPVRLYRQVA